MRAMRFDGLTTNTKFSRDLATTLTRGNRGLRAAIVARRVSVYCNLINPRRPNRAPEGSQALEREFQLARFKKGFVAVDRLLQWGAAIPLPWPSEYR